MTDVVNCMTTIDVPCFLVPFRASFGCVCVFPVDLRRDKKI
jgi:hypothetical protein